MITTQLSGAVAEIPGYAKLQRDIHNALRAQNPDWILPNGDSPLCNSYDARFAELLMQLSPGTFWRSKAANDHRFQYEFQRPTHVTTAHHIL